MNREDERTEPDCLRNQEEAVVIDGVRRQMVVKRNEYVEVEVELMGTSEERMQFEEMSVVRTKKGEDVRDLEYLWGHED